MARRARDESEWLTEFVQWLRGDPNLSAWEERFLADINHVVRHATVVLSRKQAAIVIELRDRFGYGGNAPVSVPPEFSEEVGDFGDDGSEREDEPMPETTSYRLSPFEQVSSEDALERAIQRMSNDYSDAELRKLRWNRFLKDVAPGVAPPLLDDLAA